LKLSADKGNSKAQLAFGTVVKEGTSVARNLTEASVYFKLSGDHRRIRADDLLAKWHVNIEAVNQRNTARADEGADGAGVNLVQVNLGPLRMEPIDEFWHETTWIRASSK
jgi:TPR repeat protein